MSTAPDRSQPWRDRLPIDWLAKLLVVAGGVFYGVLFVAYRLYYKPIGLRPEDGGVDNAFLAPRAVGMALICSLIAICLALFFYYYVILNSARPGNMWNQVVGVFAGALLFFLLKLTLPNVRFEIILTTSIVVVIGCFFYGLWAGKHISGSPERRQYALRLSIAIAVVVAFGFPVVALWVRAHELGLAASKGEEVSPYEIFYSLPILDVHTHRVTIRWVGSDKNWPQDLFGTESSPTPTDALLLAHDSSTLTVLVGSAHSWRVIRLNSSQINLSYAVKVH